MEFFLPNEFFACDPICDGMVIESICDGTVLGCYRRLHLERLAQQDQSIAQRLHEAQTRQVANAQKHILNLQHQRSVEKVSAFLEHMATRLPANADRVIRLPMSRYDIADYLGLSVETVSRALTTLRMQNMIMFESVRDLKVRQCQ